MKDRCRNPNFPQWKHYGGRGIKVCERWSEPLVGFDHFLADMPSRPLGHSLDRIDVDGGYSPDNCRWATRSEQQLNRRDTVRVVIDGATYKASELAQLHKIKVDTIVARAAAGLAFAAVTSPQRRFSFGGLALGGAASGAKKSARTHCPHGHLFDASNTLWTKYGHRACRACHTERERRRRCRP